MKKRTYNNVVKATKMIERKGYSHEEANEIAIQIFDESERQKNSMSIEWYIDKIRNNNEWIVSFKLEIRMV